MEDPQKRVANMLRRIAKPVQLPSQQKPDNFERGTKEGLERISLPSLGPTDREKLVERVASSDNRIRDLGMHAFEKIDQGDDNLTDDERGIAEAIILLEGRPCIDIQNDTFGQLPEEWTQLSRFKTGIEKAIRSVGRIELPNMPTTPYGGTAFVVGKNLMMTNRHVAELFTEGVGKHSLFFKNHVGTAIDFRQEIGDSVEPNLIKVRKTLMIHPYWDMALIQVDGLQEDKIITLSANEPLNVDGRAVAVIGYPMIDSRNDIDQQRRIFRGVFGKKRMLPGTLMGIRGINSFGNNVEAVTHDSSTLGGNSGSLVLDLETGQVLALHFAGRYMDANFAVPTWQLAADKRLSDLHFDRPTGGASGGPIPSWLKAWDYLKEQPIGRVETKRLAVKTVSSHREIVADWFERTTNDELVTAYQRDIEGTKALLYQTLLNEDADALVANLESTANVVETFPPVSTEEGLFGPLVNPDLPEIVFLHGITGCHLSGGAGLIDRLWLNPLAFLAGDMAEKLMLSADGLTDTCPGSHLVADGHIRYVYERATRTWRQAGFVVHPFSFDWRKSITHGADRLHLFLENLQLERPTGKPVVLVAHSMGGLVASLYAQRHPEWEERVGQAIFLGSPLRGSFAPVAAGLGTYSFLMKLAKLSRKDDIMDLRRMAVSMPGLMDMMPDPAVFPGAEAVYKVQSWPNHIVPALSILKNSKELKFLLANSPMLSVTTGIVSLVHGTVTTLQMNGEFLSVGPATTSGDGTVPARSAVILNPSQSNLKSQRRPNFKVQSLHADLPRDPAVIQGVMDIIKRGKCNLPPLTDTDNLDASLPDTETTAPIPLEESLLQESIAIRERISKNVFTQADYRWLTS